MAVVFSAADGAAQSASNPTNYTPTGGLAVGIRHIFGVRVVGTTVTSVTDNGGNTYTQLATAFNTLGTFTNHVFECIVGTAATIVTVNYAAVPTGSPVSHSYRASGANNSIAAQIVFSVNNATLTTTDGITSGPLTPAAVPGLLIGWGSPSFGGNSLTAGTGFTSRGAANTANERFEDKAMSAITATSATFTGAANGSANTYAIYLQEAAAVVQSNRVIFIG